MTTSAGVTCPFTHGPGVVPLELPSDSTDDFASGEPGELASSPPGPVCSPPELDPAPELDEGPDPDEDDEEVDDPDDDPELPVADAPPPLELP